MLGVELDNVLKILWGQGESHLLYWKKAMTENRYYMAAMLIATPVLVRLVKTLRSS